MTDPVKGASSLSISHHQTMQDASASRTLGEKANAKQGDKTAEEGGDRFKDYLEEQSITNVKRVQQSSDFDPVGWVEAQSIYPQPGREI